MACNRLRSTPGSDTLSPSRHVLAACLLVRVDQPWQWGMAQPQISLEDDPYIRTRLALPLAGVRWLDDDSYRGGRFGPEGPAATGGALTDGARCRHQSLSARPHPTPRAITSSRDGCCLLAPRLRRDLGSASICTATL